MKKAEADYYSKTRNLEQRKLSAFVTGLENDNALFSIKKALTETQKDILLDLLRVIYKSFLNDCVKDWLLKIGLLNILRVVSMVINILLLIMTFIIGAFDM